MMKRFSVILAILVGAFSVATWAFDFSGADKLFEERENNLPNIAQARGIYQQALGQTQGAELLHAVDQLGKLAYYEGELLTAENDHDHRVEIFQRCQDDVENIHPGKIGKEEPLYYYWKAACIALWGKSASSFAVLGRVGDLEKALTKGLALDETFAGGGLHRVAGSVYLKSKSLRWIPGLSHLYDPNKALQHINRSIALGPDYYNSYMVKAEVMKELGNSDEGLAFLTNKKRQLQALVRDRKLPAGLEPESKIILRQMSALMSNW